MEAIIIIYSICKLVTSTMGLAAYDLELVQKLNPTSRNRYYKKASEYST